MCTYVQVFLLSPGFPLWENLYQKLQFLTILGAVSPHFKAITVKFGERVRTWDSLPGQILYLKTLKEIYPFGENLYQKLPIYL